VFVGGYNYQASRVMNLLSGLILFFSIHCLGHLPFFCSLFFIVISTEGRDLQGFLFPPAADSK